MQTPQLIEPSLEYHRSFLEALAEYHQEGLYSELDLSTLSEPKAFYSWLEQIKARGQQGLGDVVRDQVPHRILWWVDENYIGRVRINLALNSELQEFGGHIGYDIRPSARGRGHAKNLLKAALKVAREADLDSVLLTCAPENYASIAVIEHNGGTYHDVSNAGRLRYWCKTIAD